MANTRAPKSGIDRELQQKINAKYDEELARQCLEWLQATISGGNHVSGNGNHSNGDGLDDQVISNMEGGQENVFNQLKDGYVLAKAMEALMAQSFPNSTLSKRSTISFKQREIIEIFIKKCKLYGVLDTELFQVADLYERQNLHQVVLCLQALARKAASKGVTGFGPKEAVETPRHFTDEQLQQGNAIIGLQMGTNKGASQAGSISFGARRLVTDIH